MWNGSQLFPNPPGLIAIGPAGSHQSGADPFWRQHFNVLAFGAARIRHRPRNDWFTILG